MAFLVTGAYIAILFSAGLYFIWRNRKMRSSGYSSVEPTASTLQEERRREERRRAHA